VPPRRRQLGGKLLDAILDELSNTIQDELSAASPRTLQLDGWDKDVEQLINAILTADDCEEFLGDYNATGKDKDAKSIANLVIRMLEIAEERYKPQNDDEVIVDAVVTDNPSVHQAMRPMVKKEWPKRIFLYGCWLHGISKLIEDIFSLPFFKELLAKHKLLVKKVRRKQWLHTQLLAMQKSNTLKQYYMDSKGRFRALTVKRMGETRMGSAYGMFKRNVKLSHAFAAIAANPAYNKKCGISRARAAAAEAAEAEAAAAEDASGDEDSLSDSSEDEVEAATSTARRQTDYLEIKSYMKSEKFVQDTQAAIDFVRPVMQALRVADRKSSQHSLVWETMARLDEHYAKVIDEYEGPIPADQVAQAHQFAVDRWAYLHDSTHSAAYALNPQFHDVDVGAEASVMEDLEAVFAEFYNDMYR
jgi:hypothetical protein